MGTKANRGRNPATRDARNAKIVAHRASGYLKLAVQNPVTFEKISVAERIQTLHDNGTLNDYPVEEEVYWDGTQPMLAVDKDSIPIILYIPGLQTVKNLEVIKQAVDSYREKHQSTMTPKPTMISGRNRAIKFVEGQDGGVLEFVQGHPHILLQAPDTSCSSSNVGTPVTDIVGRVAIDQAFKFQRTVNCYMLSFIDPAWHSVLSQLRVRLNEGSVVPEPKIDPSLFPSHTVTWNSIADDHRDDTDHPRGWSALNLGGDFTSGGDIKFKSLGLRVNFLPGSFMMVRSCLFTYSIAEYTGGERLSYTSYIPASIMDSYLSNFKVNPVLAPLTNIADISRVVNLKVTKATVLQIPIIPTNARVTVERGTKRKREEGEEEGDDEDEEEEGEIRVRKPFDSTPSTSKP